MSAQTDWQRLLAVLSDRRPHSSNELYDLRMVVHSRVADLRRRGYDVACWRFGKGYWYRLVSAPGERDVHVELDAIGDEMRLLLGDAV